MKPEPKIIHRSFFARRAHDAEIHRQALKEGVGVGDLTRAIITLGMRPYLEGLPIPAEVPHGVASDAGQGLDPGTVFRSVLLGSEQDEFLRHIAFEGKRSKSELLRHFIEKGLAMRTLDQESGQAREMPART